MFQLGSYTVVDYFEHVSQNTAYKLILTKIIKYKIQSVSGTGLPERHFKHVPVATTLPPYRDSIAKISSIQNNW